MRCLSDSNQCRRFCRPLPNHSAKAPLKVYKISQKKAKSQKFTFHYFETKKKRVNFESYLAAEVAKLADAPS